MGRRIYVASSWRNEYYSDVIAALRDAGHEVFDWKNPHPGWNGFHWSEIDAHWHAWNPETFRSMLDHPLSVKGFAEDFGGMEWSDTGVILLPSGRSAHLEGGWLIASGRPVYVLMLRPQEPDLMYKLATGICLTMHELIGALALPNATPRAAIALP